jgi:hypothetical protein
MPLSPDEELRIRDKVTFDLALKRVTQEHCFANVSFNEVKLGAHPEWVGELLEALAANTRCTALDLSGTGLTDAALQRLVVAMSTGCAPQLKTIDVRENDFSLAGETMAQGLSRLRPALKLVLGDDDQPKVDGFVHDKTIIEGLTAWPAEELEMPDSRPGAGNLRCPVEISGPGKPVPLKKGFQGSNGTKYTCELADFELGHGTGNMVLITLNLEAKMRLAKMNGGPEPGVLV